MNADEANHKRQIANEIILELFNGGFKKQLLILHQTCVLSLNQIKEDERTRNDNEPSRSRTD